jgi:hypothetical protein
MGFVGSGSGFSCVKTRAMLQAFAPISSTFGNDRLMSFRTGQSLEINDKSLLNARQHTSSRSHNLVATSSRR